MEGSGLGGSGGVGRKGKGLGERGWEEGKLVGGREGVDCMSERIGGRSCLHGYLMKYIACIDDVDVDAEGRDESSTGQGVDAEYDQLQENETSSGIDTEAAGSCSTSQLQGASAQDTSDTVEIQGNNSPYNSTVEPQLIFWDIWCSLWRGRFHCYFCALLQELASSESVLKN